MSAGNTQNFLPIVPSNLGSGLILKVLNIKQFAFHFKINLPSDNPDNGKQMESLRINNSKSANHRPSYVILQKTTMMFTIYFEVNFLLISLTRPGSTPSLKTGLRARPSAWSSGGTTDTPR